MRNNGCLCGEEFLNWGLGGGGINVFHSILFIVQVLYFKKFYAMYMSIQKLTGKKS
jgi:hypothetical protein